MSQPEYDDDWDVRVDTLGFLANNLRGYEPTSILREQLQNADDASSMQGRDGELTLQFLSDRLVVTNPSVFSLEDWKRLTHPNSRGKFLDANQTGEFGVGFWGALHLTDAPVVTSGDLEVTLHPRKTSRRTVGFFDGTRIEFVYRREPTPTSENLDADVVTADIEEQMAATFTRQMAELLLFTRAITAITIELPDGSRRRAVRDVKPIKGEVARLTVKVEGAPEEDCRYLIVHTEVADPPAWRHGRITVALPLTPRHRGPGRAFFMFPTETDSGLHVSVDAHFWATDDRRSLENSGPHGAWNERVFELAGAAVGRSLETVLGPTVHGLDAEEAVAWFTPAGSQLPDIARRARLFTSQLDAEARQRAVIPDRSGRLRRGKDLISLPADIEPLLAGAVSDTASATTRHETDAVYKRWGLVTWGASEVSSWLREHLPAVRTPRAEAPAFVRETASAISLLEFCRGQEQTLHGVALLLGTDDAYHPIGGSLARPLDDNQHIVTGLARPLVGHDFLSSWAAKLAPRTSPQWLREALIESVGQLVGRRVPLKDVGAASKQQHVSEALVIVSRAGGGFDGVPLALDEESRLHVFDDKTVVGLPDGNRKEAERLARRLGLRPLHKSVDDETVRRAGHRFGVSLIVELLPGVEDWDPVADSRLLVEVLGSVAHEGSTSAILVEQLRSLPIWQGSDERPHPLHELRLPARDKITRARRTLVADGLVGEPDPSSPVYATLKGLLRVDVLDTTEEVVLACEEPPGTLADRRQLLIDLGDCDHLSKAQIQRLQMATFVLCRDGHLRKPGDTLLTADRLPLRLGDRCVDDQAGQDRRVREQLTKLGAPELPRTADLLDTATEISRREIASDPTQDASRVLWEHLLVFHDRYEPGVLGELASIAWLLTAPGPSRHKPKDCYDPQLSFASLLFPVPLGVATPPQAFRDALRLRPTLETSDCVKLGRWAAQEGRPLDRQFFSYINRRCERGEADRLRIADLRSEPIVPLTSGLTKPAALVSRQRAGIWGHLRALVPDGFVADYPNLLRAWGVSLEGAVDWHEHLDVLEELWRCAEPEKRDHALAWDRLRSIAELDLDDHQIETFRRRGLLLTSLGLRPCPEALRSDLSPAVVDRLKSLLPILDESDEIAEFVERLGIRSLRSAITLDPIAEGVRTDYLWPEILKRHASNVMRFLKGSGVHLGPDIFEAWPPIVKCVTSLTVRASLADRVLVEWDAAAHLSREAGELTLYVCGPDLEARPVVDAINSEFGVDRGLKSLLLSVLSASSAQEGAKDLDWEGFPPLTKRESGYLYEPEETSVAFVDPAPQVPSAAVSVVDDHGDHDDDDYQELRTESHDHLADASDAQVEVGSSAPSGVPVAVGPNASRNGDTGAAITDDAANPPLLPLDAPPRSPRGTTDVAALEDQGIVIVRDLDVEPPEDDYRPIPLNANDRPHNNEVRVCLSFFDVSRGVIPISAKEVAWLSSAVTLREVELFGETVPAHTFGAKHVMVQDGAKIFYSRQVVPGTVMRLYPSVPGKIEIEVCPDIHRIDGVWMLEFDDAGKLTRLKQDDIELTWETDDAFYRAERRLEDIEALMADGGKSAVQLIIEVFMARPGEGLTVDQVWGLVAISRLFAKATISQILSSQTGLFAYRQGLWYKTGDRWRTARTARHPESATKAAPSRSNQVPEVIKLARKLAQLLIFADDDTLSKVVQLLGIKVLVEDNEFAQSCCQYINTRDAGVLAAIEREVRSDPGRAGLVVKELEALSTAVLGHQRTLLDLVVQNGSAASVIHAKTLLSRLDSVAGIANSDPLEEARQLTLAFSEGSASEVQLWESLERVWKTRVHGDPLTESSLWLDAVAAMEDVHRRATQLAAAPQTVLDARSATIGSLSAQLPGDVYADQDMQRLRVVLDLLCGRTSLSVLDGLYQLGLLAEKSPAGEGDAALLYALVCAHARQAGLDPSIVTRSRKRLDELKGCVAGPAAQHFVDIWTRLVRLPVTDVLRPLST